MKKLIAILLVPLFSGCMNMFNQAIVGVDGTLLFIPFSGPDYDELVYSGTRAMGSELVNHRWNNSEDWKGTPFLIIDIPLEIAMDTITFPYGLLLLSVSNIGDISPPF